MIEIHTKTELTWQQHLSAAITSLTELVRYLDLPENLIHTGNLASQQFKLLAPKPFLQRIEKGNPKDPLLLQILPNQLEDLMVEGYTKDPLAEAEHTPQKALVHKYKSRLLVITTGVCAVNCRYCFRRHFPYGDNQLAQTEWQSVLDYLIAHPDINEVILSGGDPLIMKDAQLAQRVASLEALPQITRLRIHSRLPVVIPQRVNQELLTWIKASRLNIILVFHINHANEIDGAVQEAANKLTAAGVTLLNQGVILQGVNDNVSAQVSLSERLFAVGILPYYMFTFDPVAGAAHFDIDISSAQELMGQVAAELPGYLVPRLAKEIPGKSAKTLLAPTLSNALFIQPATVG